MAPRKKAFRSRGNGFRLAAALMITLLLIDGALGGRFVRCIAEAMEAAPAMPMGTPRPGSIQTDVSAPAVLEDAPMEEIVYPAVREGFLPVCGSRITGEKVVALTFDDCNQAENLREIVRLIAGAGGRATIFPIGENVSFLGEILRVAVDCGFEIENHTYSHSGLYSESDEGLAYQIFAQNQAVSRALGVDYQMHFLRPRGGDNRYDQRTHAYMRQMGYHGLAFWSKNGSKSTAESIMADLQPGEIILFHTTDRDLEIVKALVPLLRAEGYRMITLNELFGLPENEQGTWSGEREIMPLRAFERFDQILQCGDYLYDVLQMQRRLEALGYLSGKYNGYFGQQTKEAVIAFQTACGLDADGVCGPDTWNALFSE